MAAVQRSMVFRCCALVLALARACHGLSPLVATLAGRSAGFVNSIGTSAKFNTPNAVAVDSTGAVYVADCNNNAIRFVTPDGTVSTLAGGGPNAYGFANGLGTLARFSNPNGVAVDASGNVYVADTFNYAVRVIGPNGAVSTLAGTNISGFLDGVGTSARFNRPSGLAVDVGGNVCACLAWSCRSCLPMFTNVCHSIRFLADVGDQSNHAIRVIAPNGTVTTLAGGGPSAQSFLDGLGTSARFYSPIGVAVDVGGNVYVADMGNNAIRVIAPNGAVTTLAGGGPSSQSFLDGLGTSARFKLPLGVAVDASGTVCACHSLWKLHHCPPLYVC